MKALVFAKCTRAISLSEVCSTSSFLMLIVFPQVVLHQQSLAESAVITRLLSQVHKTSGEILRKRPRALTKGVSAMVVMETVRPMCVELYRDVKELGRFMLRVSGVTIAAGLITKVSVRLTMKKANFYVKKVFFFFIKRKKEKKYPNVF